MKARIGHLHVITDTATQNRYRHAELAELAIAGGADTIQYRSKSSDIRELLKEAGETREVCRAAGVTFLVNDRVDICLAIDADGVHLGRSDMPIPIARRLLGPDKIIGGTVRNAVHLEQAVHDSADYVGLGPIYTTSSKQLPLQPLGTQTVREVSAVSPIPIIGIAGITNETIAEVIEAGAYGVAVIGAVCNAQDVTAATRQLAEILGNRKP